jgi:hypothetical protein
VTGGCGNWIRTVSFLGWGDSGIGVRKIDQKSAGCHSPIVESLGKMRTCLRPADRSRGFP